jgi:dolichol-phosphate mannosyltransferase
MISIIIPTVNEEKNISKTLNRISSIKFSKKFEIIVVDDLSKDNTEKEVKRFKKKLKIKFIKNKKKLGLGYALKIGYNLAKYNYVLFLDADLAVSKKYIDKIIKLRSKNCIVVGSRFAKGGEVIGAPKIKIILSNFLNKIIKILFSIEINDISQSFRIISKNIPIKCRNYTHPGFFWETTVNARKLNFKIKEFPIIWRERKHGKTKNTNIKMIKSVVTSFYSLIIFSLSR